MKFYGGDAARFVRALKQPKVVQQGLLADAALNAAVRAEQRQRERNDRREQWLTLAGYLIDKEDRDVDCA
jgi:hypothetical protein